MRWLDEVQARELLSEGWRRYACVIAVRRGEIQRNLDRFIESAYRTIDGYEGAVDEMRSSYRNMQLFARLLGDLMAAVREVHRERGTTLREGEVRTLPLPSVPDDPDELLWVRVPLVKVRWLAEAPHAAS